MIKIIQKLYKFILAPGYAPRVLAVFIVTLFITSITYGHVAALPQGQRKLFNSGVYYFNVEETTFQGRCTGADFSGGSYPQVAFNYLISRGLTKEQSAGVVGNLMQETKGTVDPKTHQDGGGPGRGIAQWTVTERWVVLLEYAEALNKDPLTLELQLDFLWFEMTGEPEAPGITGGYEKSSYQHLIATKTIEEATRSFSETFLRPGKPHMDRRIQYAQNIYTAFSGDTSGGVSCSQTSTAGIDVFPLDTTKAKIQQGASGARWCYASTSNCHHDYNAADIHDSVGTAIVAVKAGTVVSATEQIGGVGSRITIRGSDGQYTYYYAHMAFGSLTVRKDDSVTAGQTLGNVGDRNQAVGTPPHLHFDMLPQAEYPSRPACSGASCSKYPFIDVQPLLVRLYETTVPD